MTFAWLLCASAIFTLQPDNIVLQKVDNLGTTAGGAKVWERVVEREDSTVRITGVTFSSKKCRLTVIDNPPEARKSLRDALASVGAVAGTNGGYFHKDDTAVGLVVSGGKVLHPFERAQLLSGVIIVRKNGSTDIMRSRNFFLNEDVVSAVQAGPWLVEKGEYVNGLNDGKLARRTVLTTDGIGNWALMVFSPISLANTARILSHPNHLLGWPVYNALNLDGGSSTSFWAEATEIPAYSTVRNFVGIVPR